MKIILPYLVIIIFFRECLRLCEGTGLRPHTFTKINKDKEKFNPKLAQKFGKYELFENISILYYTKLNITIN